MEDYLIIIFNIYIKLQESSILYLLMEEKF